MNNQSSFSVPFPAWPLWLLGALLALVHGAFLINQATSFFADLGGFERNVLWVIQHKCLGGLVYENPKSSPFSITQYGPFYYYIISILTFIFGIVGDNSRGIIQLSRFVNFFLLLGIASGVYIIGFRTFKISYTAAFFVAVLAFLVLGQNFISGRPDALKAAFTLLSFYAALRFVNTEKLYWQLIAFFFSSAAFLTKQDGLIAFFPIFIYHIFNRSAAVEWVKTFIIALGFSILLAGLLVTHPFAVFNLVDGLKNGLSLSWFLSVFQNYFSYLALILLLAVLGVVKLTETMPKSAILMGSFLFVYTLFPGLFSLKYGSGINYFNELLVFSFLASSVLIEPLVEKLPKLAFLVLFVFLLVFKGVSTSRELVSIFLGNQSELKKQFNSQQEIAGWLKQNQAVNQSVLCLISRQWEDHFTNLAPSLVLVPQRDVMEQIFRAAPQTELVVACKTYLLSGHIKYIVTDKSTIPAFLGVSFKPDLPVYQTGGYFVFEKPKAL